MYLTQNCIDFLMKFRSFSALSLAMNIITPIRQSHVHVKTTENSIKMKQSILKAQACQWMAIFYLNCIGLFGGWCIIFSVCLSAYCINYCNFGSLNAPISSSSIQSHNFHAWQADW